MVKKVIVNDRLDYQFHPNAISLKQINNIVYFYQVLNSAVDESQTVLLRSYDLVSHELKVVGQPEEISHRNNKGKLLSVGFFKKIEHQ
jgi:hypothetical protein